MSSYHHRNCLHYHNHHHLHHHHYYHNHHRHHCSCWRLNCIMLKEWLLPISPLHVRMLIKRKLDNFSCIYFFKLLKNIPFSFIELMSNLPLLEILVNRTFLTKFFKCLLNWRSKIPLWYLFLLPSRNYYICLGWEPRWYSGSTPDM